MKHFLTILILIISVSVSFAQKDTVDVLDAYASGGTEGTLNTAVQAAIDNGTLSNTVFKLAPYGLYVLTGAIITPAGQTLEIVAPTPGNDQQSAPPMISWTPSSAPDKRYSFDIGGELIMKNIWILSGSIDGTQVGSTIRIGDSASVAGGRCTFENVIVDYSPCPQNGGGAVEMYATHFKGYFKNCYFRNCVDSHLRYYGRALSFRYNTYGLHADSVMFENCTFANMGYVYMQENNEYGDNVHFNHCTFYNIIMFCLESGWWWKMSVTNSLFVNTFMYGAIPANDGEGAGGTISIVAADSIDFDVPFTDPDRHILVANNNYFVESWLVDWMKNNPYSKDLRSQRRNTEIPVPMSAMNGDTKGFFDSTDVSGAKAFPFINKTEIDSIDPGFINPPIALDSLKQFLYRKWWDNADVNWAWNLSDALNQIWPITESLTYTNSDLLTAGMGGYPLGDLYRWFPNQYESWKAQKDGEYKYIYNWLETGKTDTNSSYVSQRPGIVKEYSLGQNYPNPFNPTTQIEYSIPKEGYVSLKVFNSLGQEVQTLFSGHQGAGNYVATFDGTGLSSGIYLYQLQSGNVTIAKKFVLTK